MIDRLGISYYVFGGALVAVALVVGARLLAGGPEQESFHVVVDTHPLIAIGDVLSTDARVLPDVDAQRAEVWFDDQQLERTTLGGAGALELTGLQPGYNLFETHLRRRGRSVETVVATVLAGHFTSPGEVETCSVRANISAEAFVRIAKREIGSRLLESVQSGEGARFFGPTTRIARDTLTLVAGGAEFNYALESNIDAVAVSGRVELSGGRGATIDARLVDSSFRLEKFSGKHRRMAEGFGLAGGGTVGLLCGPLAWFCVPAGALLGARAGGSYVRNKARQKAAEKIRGALSEFSAWSLRGTARLLDGNPQSQIDLEMCDDFQVDALGVSSLLSLRPKVAYPAEGWVLPGVLDLGVAVPSTRTAQGDVDLLIPLDLFNLFLDTWTRSGVLQDLARADVHLEDLDAVLAENTTLARTDFAMRGPPIVSGGDRASWRAAIGAITLVLADARTGLERRIVVGASGDVQVEYDDLSGEGWLAGELSQLHLVCEEGLAEHGVALTPCFAAVLDLDSLREDWNAAIAPSSRSLPRFDVRGMIARRTAALHSGSIIVKSIKVDAPSSSPGVLRVRAWVE